MNDSEKKIRTLKAMVEEILRTIPAARDSDITLTIEVWRRFYNAYIFQKGDTKYGDPKGEAILLSDLFNLPREDNVKRIRADLQNDPVRPLYPPTKWEIAEQRGMNETHWRRALNYEASSARTLDLS